MISEKFEVSNSYRRYVLFILVLVYTFNFIDRQILVILQEPIKAELGLSDTQLGLMTGLAFALFYVLIGLPIARLADRSNRRNIVAISLTIWSAMTALSGIAQNYTQLLFARIGVGIGEAGGSPPAHAMISDYYPPGQRATALSIYSTGIYIGIMFGFLAGGYISDTFGWRYAFFIVGVPGILLAIILRLTVKEPPRGFHEKGDSSYLTLKEVYVHFKSSKVIKLAAFGGSFNALVLYGNGNFMPSFLSRVHGLSSTDIGIILALASGIGGAIGTFSGGYLTDHFGKVDKRWYMWIPALGILLSVPLGFFALMTENILALTIVSFLHVFCHTMYLGPSIATCHSLSKPAMRALVSALLFFLLNLIGLGMGPLMVGLLSDFFTVTYGAHGIKYALMINLGITPIIAVGLFYYAGKYLPQELKK